MVAEVASLRPLSDIGLIVGDGIFTGSTTLDRVGIHNTANLMLERYHVLDEDCTRFFGPNAFAQFFPHLSKLLDSNTEGDYNTRKDELLRKVERNLIWVNYIKNRLHAQLKLIVKAWTSKLPMNMKKGSQGSESNNVS